VRGVRPVGARRREEGRLCGKATGLALLRQGERGAVTPDLPRYDIDQAIDDQKGTFAGKETVGWTNTTSSAVTVLPLLLHPNSADELKAKDSGKLAVEAVTDENGKPLAFAVKRPTLVEVTLAKPLAVGARVTISVKYAGKLRQLSDDANDIYSQAMGSLSALTGGGDGDYGLLAEGDGIVTCASAYPMIAPLRAGAFDTGPPAAVGDVSYSGVGVYSVRTVVPDGVTIYSNLIDAAPVPLAGGGTVFSSEGALVRDLVLVAGRDLEKTDTMAGATKVTSIYRAKDAPAGKKALDEAAFALADYEKRFGPYPYTELDVAESSLVGGAGGVEFSGMILIAGMLYRDPADSNSQLGQLMNLLGKLNGQLDLLGGGGDDDSDGEAPQKLGGMMDSELEFTVAHEVGHQWFYGIVGNDAGRDASLDEPLAQFAAGLAFEDRHGVAAAQKAMDTNVKMNYAVMRLMGGRDNVVARDASAFKTTVEYAGLVYGKAPYAYVALRTALGDAKMMAAMRSAIAKSRFQIITLDDWIAGLEAGGATGARATMQRWFREAHGDQDLHVDDSGDFVLDSMFPPDVAEKVHATLDMLGMKPRDLMKMVFGGIGDTPDGDASIDPDDALKRLENL
jgi:hypothetical protein